MHSIDTDDLTLIRATLQGEKENYLHLINRYKGMVFNLAYRMTGNVSEAEDLAQEAFINAYTHLASFNLAQEFPTWLYTITLNACKSRLRKKRIPQVSLDREPAEDGPRIQVGDSKEDPQERAALNEGASNFRRLLHHLPFKYRSVFVLRYLENRSYQEIAAITQLPLGTVKTYLFRGQQILTDKLADNPS